eukprot:CAMPEP_0169483130 /NCGR_PEP_ID=MMETSP1042-20121227/31054_1 /TAXON_ID=464988 /ORGANISM="Hemiselmis andersenii, Strain CCMP1180" /LENGTH=34 /DNA_ID= /DNA_START= /DNA_END= /DNA_ORIENTATION=
MRMKTLGIPRAPQTLASPATASRQIWAGGATNGR